LGIFSTAKKMSKKKYLPSLVKTQMKIKMNKTNLIKIQ
jgi:hypothetical protein